MKLTFGSGSFTAFGASRPLLSSQIIFGEALLPSLTLPVVIADPSSVNDDSTSKLAEHGLGSDDGDLA